MESLAPVVLIRVGIRNLLLKFLKIHYFTDIIVLTAGK